MGWKDPEQKLKLMIPLNARSSCILQVTSHSCVESSLSPILFSVSSFQRKVGVVLARMLMKVMILIWMMIDHGSRWMVDRLIDTNSANFCPPSHFAATTDPRSTVKAVICAKSFKPVPLMERCEAQSDSLWPRELLTFVSTFGLMLLNESLNRSTYIKKVTQYRNSMHSVAWQLVKHWKWNIGESLLA